LCISAQDDIRAARGLLEKITEAENFEEQSTALEGFTIDALPRLLRDSPSSWAEHICPAGKELL